MLEIYFSDCVFKDGEWTITEQPIKWGRALCNEEDSLFQVVKSPFDLPSVNIKNYSNLDLSALLDKLGDL